MPSGDTPNIVDLSQQRLIKKGESVSVDSSELEKINQDNMEDSLKKRVQAVDDLDQAEEIDYALDDNEHNFWD